MFTWLNGSSHQSFLQKNCSRKFRNTYRKTSQFLNLILKAHNFIKKRFQHSCFYKKIFKNTYFEKHLKTLCLLNIIITLSWRHTCILAHPSPSFECLFTPYPINIFCPTCTAPESYFEERISFQNILSISNYENVDVFCLLSIIWVVLYLLVELSRPFA